MTLSLWLRFNRPNSLFAFYSLQHNVHITGGIMTTEFSCSGVKRKHHFQGCE